MAPLQKPSVKAKKPKSKLYSNTDDHSLLGESCSIDGRCCLDDHNDGYHIPGNIYSRKLNDELLTIKQRKMISDLKNQIDRVLDKNNSNISKLERIANRKQNSDSIKSIMSKKISKEQYANIVRDYKIFRRKFDLEKKNFTSKQYIGYILIYFVCPLISFLFNYFIKANLDNIIMFSLILSISVILLVNRWLMSQLFISYKRDNLEYNLNSLNKFIIDNEYLGELPEVSSNFVRQHILLKNLQILSEDEYQVAIEEYDLEQYLKQDLEQDLKYRVKDAKSNDNTDAVIYNDILCEEESKERNSRCK